MSWVERRAFVKIFGGGKLGGVSICMWKLGNGYGMYGRVAIDSEESDICSR